ncbi:MAG: hypothetical protein FWD03_05065 [Defluviitaleaceae bacterium]|nr:hypothetical protein [Defluviitaleaceae bacterium]
MKIFVEKTIAQESLDEVHCNMCGLSVKKNDLGYFDDHLSVDKTWGYGTPIDGDTHAFDLCFDCYSRMIDKFVIPPRVLADMSEV